MSSVEGKNTVTSLPYVARRAKWGDQSLESEEGRRMRNECRGTRTKNKGIFFIKTNDYIYSVSYVEDHEKIFLKTMSFLQKPLTPSFRREPESRIA